VSIIVVITSSGGHTRLRPKTSPEESIERARIMKEVSPTLTTSGTIDQFSVSVETPRKFVPTIESMSVLFDDSSMHFVSF
jgi:hypothetical protein